VRKEAECQPVNPYGWRYEEMPDELTEQSQPRAPSNTACSRALRARDRWYFGVF
jgi:hypothetical protein